MLPRQDYPLRWKILLTVYIVLEKRERETKGTSAWERIINSLRSLKSWKGASSECCPLMHVSILSGTPCLQQPDASCWVWRSPERDIQMD